MTNQEFATTLETLAIRYRENEFLLRPRMHIAVWEKGELIKTVKFIGGKWKKSEPQENDYSIILTSLDFPEMSLSIPRNKICRKIVTFECEPLMSPEDEAEVLGVLTA